MKIRALMIMGGLMISGCFQWVAEPYPELIETEKPLVAGCEFLGVVAETAAAENPFPLAAKTNMILRVRERSGMLGASHIVWLHKTAHAATAETFRCPQP